MPTYYLVLVALLFIKLPKIEPSKTDYCNIVRGVNRHLLCDKPLSDKPCYNKTGTYPITFTDRAETLKAINDIRAGVANGTLQIGSPKFTPPQANNMYQLKWDMECENAARNLIIYCKHYLFLQKYSNIFARFEAGLYIDANFYNIVDNITTIADLLRLRFKGNRYHDYRTTHGFLLEAIKDSFLSQLSIFIKAEVSVVGCAMVIGNLGYRVSGNLACVFGGIDSWQLPYILYESGPPCCKCPVGSQCSRKHPGLCECKKRCYSYSRDARNSGFYNSYAIAVDRETEEDVIIPLKDIDNASYSYISYFRYLNSTPIITNLTTITSTMSTEAFITIPADDEQNFEPISSEPSPYCIVITIFAAEIVTVFIL